MYSYRRELLNILLLDPLHLGSVIGFSFINLRKDELDELPGLLVSDPEDHSNPRTIGLNAGCHEVSLKKIDIGQFMYKKYRIKGIKESDKTTMVKISSSTCLSILKESMIKPIRKKEGIDRISIQTAYIGYLSFNNCPSEFTKIPFLFKDTSCFLEIKYGVRNRLAKDISGILNMLDSTKPTTNMAQNIRFQKLSFDRNLFVMVFCAFLIFIGFIISFYRYYGNDFLYK